MGLAFLGYAGQSPFNPLPRNPSVDIARLTKSRRDEFILTSLLNTNLPIPPLCTTNSFCPDDASGCLPLVPVGGKCQLNRDGTFHLVVFFNFDQY